MNYTIETTNKTIEFYKKAGYHKKALELTPAHTILKGEEEGTSVSAYMEIRFGFFGEHNFVKIASTKAFSFGEVNEEDVVSCLKEAIKNCREVGLWNKIYDIGLYYHDCCFESSKVFYGDNNGISIENDKVIICIDGEKKNAVDLINQETKRVQECFVRDHMHNADSDRKRVLELVGELTAYQNKISCEEREALEVLGEFMNLGYGLII